MKMTRLIIVKCKGYNHFQSYTYIKSSAHRRKSIYLLHILNSLTLTGYTSSVVITVVIDQ